MSVWNIEGVTLIKYTGEAKRVVVPEEVRHISSNAFTDAPNLRELVITKKRNLSFGTCNLSLQNA